MKNEDVELLTIDQFKAALPRKVRMNVSQETIDEINAILISSPEREAFRDNLLGFGSILQEGKYSVKAYVNAVRYCGFKLTGDTNLQAYIKTFPQRYQKMLDQEWAEKDINSQVSAFHRTQLVTKILEQALVPQWLLNQDLYQKALNVQATLMMSARSEKVRCDAANSLLTQLKMPETQKVSLDVSVKEDDSINELRKATLELVAQQRRALESGITSAKEIAEQKVISGETIDGDFQEVER
jgi:hypothetical protein